MNRLREIFENRRIRMALTAIAVVVLAFLALMIRNAVENQMSESYRVIKEEEKTDSVSKYAYTEDGVVRYSSDGAAMLNRKLETVWNVTYSMSHPQVAVCRDEVLIYDCGGTSMLLADGKQQKSSFTSQLPILRACVSAKGTAAALLEDGEKTSFAYYSDSGSEIASGEASITNPGYPVSLSLSEDGLRLAISYLTASDGNAGSTVRFYSFSKSGRSQENNQSGEANFSGELVPEVHYLGNRRCVVFRENGFTVFKGKESPTEETTVNFDQDIVSAFSGANYFGYVFQSEERGGWYTVRVYSSTGKLRSEFAMDHSYDGLCACDDELIFYTSSEFHIYTLTGSCRFSGESAEGSVTAVLRMNRREHMLVTDHRLEIIELT